MSIPMATNCAPLVADLFFSSKFRFHVIFFWDKEAEIIEAFISTSRYLDDLWNIDNNYFDGIVNQISPSELQLNKTNSSDTEATFLDLHLIVSDCFIFFLKL